MGFFKILAGVGAGVAAVTLLPVAGPIGAVTLAGAAIGGGLGGAAGIAASASEKKKLQAAKESGKLEETAKFKVKTKKMLSALDEAEKRLQADKEYFNLLLALTAMGIATANADGKISDEELVELDEFVAGVGNSKLPPHVKGAITKMRNSPPTFSTAMCYVEKVDKNSWPLFEEVIKVVAAADGKTDKRENYLLEAWRRCANE